MAYYNNTNPELLARIPLQARRVLEIGCGEGNFAQVYRQANPAATYVGVELFAGAGRQAAAHMDHVIVGDIEQPSVLAAIDEVNGGEFADVLILGDLLEHLRDPWRVLADLRGRVAPAGICVACLPNVGHWSIVHQQLRGRWEYTDSGLMDRTHLRFFTLESALALFRQAGWTVLDATPRFMWPEKTEAAVQALLPLAESMGINPVTMRRDLSAFQWVIRAVNGPLPAFLSVVGMGLPKQAGVNEPRLDHPLAALATLPAVRTACGAGGLSLPSDWPPGVFVLHRQFLNEAGVVAHIERMIAKGWVIVSDMDDDPSRWPEFGASDYFAYRGVHAVTVTTEPLAAVFRQWNPHVQVFPNAILAMPRIAATTPKQGEKLRIFFGALNRGGDWAEVLPALGAAAESLAERVEFVVVHDREFFAALPEGVSKEFHPTLVHDQYVTVLASCDLALLPLADTPFNRLKSDLKFIECCAAGVVPLCSPVIYGEAPTHREIGVFASSPEEWRLALIALAADLPEIRRRRELGLRYVQGERMHAQQAGARERYYRELLANREQLEAERQERLQRRPPEAALTL